MLILRHFGELWHRPEFKSCKFRQIVFRRFDKIEKNSLINVPEAIGEIKKKFGLELKRVIVRQPNLNDVFLWVNFK